jgi:hypothetical protein
MGPRLAPNDADDRAGWLDGCEQEVLHGRDSGAQLELGARISVVVCTSLEAIAAGLEAEELVSEVARR